MYKNLLLLLVFLDVFSQELSPIQSFDMDEYNANGQNWMISQSDDKNLFFANNDGLLKFNGNEWSLFKTPRNTIIRSVKYIDSIVYTGQSNDFGFWNKSKNGSYSYTSIPDEYNFKFSDYDEEFWNILKFKNWIVFQSFSRLIFYDPNSKEINTIKPEGGVWKSFVINDNLYFSIVNRGIYKIEKGTYEPFNTNIIFSKENIINLFESNNRLLALTEYSGFFELSDKNKVSKWDSYINETDELTVYSAINNSDGTFSIGTIKKGLLKLDKNGKLMEVLDKKNSIINNTVLSIFEDVNKNLWLGLDNGISVVNYNSAFKIYDDYEGKIGTVYAFKKFNNNIYIGTNQGLYYKNDSPVSDFTLMEGMAGQVWTLEIIDGELFCGHNNGTYILNNGNVKKIKGTQGSWTFRKSKSKDLIFEGNYYGINVLQKKNNKWEKKNNISGFDISSRFFELTENNKIIVVHGFRGVYKLTLDSNYENFESVEIDSLSIDGNPGLSKFNQKIYYKNKNAMYYYNESKDSFVEDSLLTIAANPTGLIRTDNNKLWIFSKDKIYYAFNDDVNNEVILKSVLIPDKFKRTVFENISSTENEINIIGTTNGYISLDLNKYKLSNKNFTIDKIVVNSVDSNPYLIDNKSDFILKYKENNISFNFGVTNYQLFERNEFQHRLIGYNDNWSNWTEKPSISYNNLLYGKYTFEVRTKNGSMINPEKKQISFIILRPWYLSNFMYINYSLIAGLMVFLTNRYTRRYYIWKEKRIEKINKEKLKIKEIERKESIATLENEKLQQDIENKNRELAVSTMSMIKKNQFLNMIKNELKKTKDDKQIKKVIKTIDSNLNNEDDWKFFEEAFNNADREFLKKIKSLHESLTKNDLKLCAYLRLNLSSKDIAPLLNISLRSVEIKRYRLRKKIQLSHNEGLTEYILSI